MCTGELTWIHPSVAVRSDYHSINLLIQEAVGRNMQIITACYNHNIISYNMQMETALLNCK